MSYNIEGIKRVTDYIKKDLDFAGRAPLGDLQTVSLALALESTEQKVIVLQLIDYITYLTNLHNSLETVKDEKKLQVFMSSLSSLDSMAKVAATRVQTLADKNQENQTRVEQLLEENLKLKEKISNALKIWSKDDQTFEDPTIREIAETLTGRSI